MRIMVVEDHPIVMGAVCAFLEKRGHKIVATAESVDEALSSTRNVEMDMAVMDIVLGDKTAMEVLKTLKRELPVVAFTGRDSPEFAREFLTAGGLGFVSKSCRLEDLSHAIESAAVGRSFVAPETLRRRMADRSSRLEPLSQREREVVGLISAGLSSRLVADKLFVSVSTIKTHRLRIFRKLGVHSVAELTKYAVDHRLTND